MKNSKDKLLDKHWFQHSQHLLDQLKNNIRVDLEQRIHYLLNLWN